MVLKKNYLITIIQITFQVHYKDKYNLKELWWGRRIFLPLHPRRRADVYFISVQSISQIVFQLWKHCPHLRRSQTQNALWEMLEICFRTISHLPKIFPTSRRPDVSVSHRFWPWLLSVSESVQRKTLRQVQSVTTCTFQGNKKKKAELAAMQLRELMQREFWNF